MSDFIYGLHPASAFSNNAYHALDAVGKSDLDLIARSPAHWKHAVREETAAMRFGSAVHCAVLEPERFETEYVCAPNLDKRTKAGKDAFAEFQAKHDGKTALEINEYTSIGVLAHTVRTHPRVAQFLASGQPEVSALWKDEEFQVRCRARFDWMTPDGWLIDLKTTTDASPAAFARSCASFRYHVQAAWYLDGYPQASGGDLPLGFIFIAVEKTAPYGIALYELDADAVELGRQLARRDLARYANARTFDQWPGYPDAIQPLSLPRWAMNQEIEE
jgi:exodeoxyribonuclease VIII